MRQQLTLLSLIGALLFAVSPGQVLAGDCVAPISWGETYAYETNYNTGTNISNPGSQLSIVGLVNCFSGQFNDLDPIGTEYTVYLFDLLSNGTSVQVNGPLAVHQTVYDGGTVQVWEDGGGDANFADNPPNADVPSTFANGTMILEGNLEGMTVNITFVNGAYSGGNFDTGLPPGAIFTGGTLLDRVKVGGEGCPLRVTGGWNVTPSALPPGYSADVEGKIDIECPVQNIESTWGRMKALYN